MSITVRCHASDGGDLCPDKMAGIRIKCPRCEAELHIPRGVAIPGSGAPALGTAPDWSSSPPAVQDAGPAAPDPVRQEPDSAPRDMENRPAPYTPPKPWCYGFLEKYTAPLTWAAVISCTLLFAGFTVFMLFDAVAAAADKTAAADTGRTILLEGRLVVYWLAGAIGYAAAIALILFTASRVLLAVEAGRNLRAIRFHKLGPQDRSSRPARNAQR